MGLWVGVGRRVYLYPSKSCLGKQDADKAFSCICSFIFTYDSKWSACKRGRGWHVCSSLYPEWGVLCPHSSYERERKHFSYVLGEANGIPPLYMFWKQWAVQEITAYSSAILRCAWVDWVELGRGRKKQTSKWRPRDVAQIVEWLSQIPLGPEFCPNTTQTGLK